MKNVYKIAFTGKMGSGKSSAALQALGVLAEKHGPDNSIGFIIKFANPLHTCAVAFHRKEKPRVFLQSLGDLARQEFGDDVFQQIFRNNVEGFLANKLPQLKQEHVLLMTDDLRFRGEYELVKELGFTVIRMETDEALRYERLGNLMINVKHRSEVETELFEPDFVIHNNTPDPQMLDVEAQLKQLFSEHNLIGV